MAKQEHIVMAACAYSESIQSPAWICDELDFYTGPKKQVSRTAGEAHQLQAAIEERRAGATAADGAAASQNG